MADWNLSTELLPPILEYAYPSIDCQTSTITDNHKIGFTLSVLNNGIFTNSADRAQYEFQIRAVDTKLGREGLNITHTSVAKDFTLSNSNLITFTYSATEAAQSWTIDSDGNISITLPASMTVDSSIASIFVFETSSDGSKIIESKNFKIQIRLVKIVTAGTLYEYSDWSNGSVIRGRTPITLSIQGMDNFTTTTINNVVYYQINKNSIKWVGAYNTESNNLEEVTSDYKFTLIREDNNVTESSDWIQVEDYAVPTYVYKFASQLENSIKYTMKFTIQTNYGATIEVVYHLLITLDYQRPFTSYEVIPNNDEGYNTIKLVDAEQKYLLWNGLLLVGDKGLYRKDQATINLTEDKKETYTHLQIGKNCAITSDSNIHRNPFVTSPNTTLTVILTITKLVAYPTEEEALADNNCLFRICDMSNGSVVSNASDIKVGVLDNTAITSLMTSAEQTAAGIQPYVLVVTESYCGVTNRYEYELDPAYLKTGTQELYMIIQKFNIDYTEAEDADKKKTVGKLFVDISTTTTQWIANSWL